MDSGTISGPVAKTVFEKMYGTGRAAAAIVDRHDGEVPRGYDDLIALPGVGDYTASAIASFAFGGSHAVLDTNVRRVFARAVGGVEFPATAVTKAERALAEARSCSAGYHAASLDAPTTEGTSIADRLLVEMGRLEREELPRRTPPPAASVARWTSAVHVPIHASPPIDAARPTSTKGSHQCRTWRMPK